MFNMKTLMFLFLLSFIHVPANSDTCPKCADDVSQLKVTVSEKDWNVRVMQYTLYSVAGWFTILGNIFIFVTILRSEELRKKYVMVLVLATGDLAVGIGYASAAIHRLHCVTKKLDYLQWLGIRIIWLSPVYKSPMKDFGYDVSDYREIDPVFGTLEDFQNLISELHCRNMHCIMDFVPNHTSDLHDWFIRSKKQEEPYSDYYIWRNGSKPKPGGCPQSNPPNNWQSCFGGSAWTWCEERQQFYLHQFLKEQPDLNFRNSLVRKDMEDVLAFWMDRGVDGFRIDATSHLIEHEDFLDNVKAESPRAQAISTAKADGPNPDNSAEETGYYSQEREKQNAKTIRYDVDQPETYELIREWVQFVRQYGKSRGKHIVLMTESYSSMEEMKKYYSAGVDFPFNFKLCSNWTRDSSTATNLKEWIKEWMCALRPGDWPNWVLGNHDQPRLASKLGSPDFVHVAHMLLLLLPGTATCYNGDELGIENVKVLVIMNVDFRSDISLQPVRVHFSENRGKIVLRTENFTPDALYQVGSQVKLSFGLTPGQGLVVKHEHDFEEPDKKRLKLTE